MYPNKRTKETVTREQYDHTVAYYMSKYNDDVATARAAADNRYIVAPTPARYLIDNPTSDIYQIPKFRSLDHDAGLIYFCDDSYDTPNGLSPYRTEKV